MGEEMAERTVGPAITAILAFVANSLTFLKFSGTTWLHLD